MVYVHIVICLQIKVVERRPNSELMLAKNLSYRLNIVRLVVAHQLQPHRRRRQRRQQNHDAKLHIRHRQQQPNRRRPHFTVYVDGILLMVGPYPYRPLITIE